MDTHAAENDLDSDAPVEGPSRGRAPSHEPGVVDDDFVPRRRGRGGFDPEADALARAARYAFRQRAVLGLVFAAITTAALAFIISPTVWWLCGLSVAVLVGYLLLSPPANVWIARFPALFGPDAPGATPPAGGPRGRRRQGAEEFQACGAELRHLLRRRGRGRDAADL